MANDEYDVSFLLQSMRIHTTTASLLLTLGRISFSSKVNPLFPSNRPSIELIPQAISSALIEEIRS
jgi:hypothetical protein